MRKIRRLAASSALLCLGAAPIALFGASPKTFDLWPGQPPGEKKALEPERDITKPKDDLIAGKRVIRLGNVSKPTITVYSPSARKNTGAAVVVCPGGGYYILAMDLEGTEVCEWLNSIGVTGILLKYRVPKREGDDTHQLPLADAERTMSLTREHAKEWGIDPSRIGVLGFSAGGHLSAALSTSPQDRAYVAVDDADKQDFKPNFTFLIYPGYLADHANGNKLTPGLNITSNTPPTFSVMAEDDPVRPENVLYYTLALKEAKVPAELHVYPTGGHGYGLRPSKHLVTTWPKRAEEWMRSRGYLDRAK